MESGRFMPRLRAKYPGLPDKQALETELALHRTPYRVAVEWNVYPYTILYQMRRLQVHHLPRERQREISR